MSKSVIALFIVLLVSIELVSAQTPIMIITCRGRAAFMIENSNSKNLSNYEDSKISRTKSLKNAGMMMPDCSVATCLTCDPVLTGGLFWDPDFESCDCFVDIGDAPPVPVEFSESEDCNCPEGTIVTKIDQDGDGILDTTCAYPECFTGSYDTMIECGQEDLIIDVELCALTGAAAEGSVLVVESLVGCEFVSANSFDMLSQGGTNTVGLGPADEDGCIQFQIELEAADAPASISFDGEETLDLEIPVCPTVSDPCTCDKLFSNEPTLFTDELSIMGLPVNADVELSNTYMNAGFRDNMAMLIAGGSPLGTTNAVGNLDVEFFRGPAEIADIELRWITADPDRTGVISFKSDTACPLFEECTPLPEVIPTLSEWGLISLSILLMIIGIAWIKSMQQENIERSFK